MLFPTWQFLVFLLVLVATLSVLQSYRWKKIVLLVASYFFYMSWNPVFILLIIASTVIDYTVGRRMERSDEPRVRRALLIASICANLGVLGFFKYANFFQENLLSVLGSLGYAPEWDPLNITLPVGISFYTFQTMSYSIDLYRRQIPVCRSPLDFSLFVSFFPQLVAGPIVRAADFLPQLTESKKMRLHAADLMLILRGLMKKVLIADNLAHFVDSVFEAPGSWPSAIVWLGTLAFAIQIYCDFSGYSDIAIGVARLLGFKLPLNFDWPYFATNPSMFWRKWHISLSQWLRDYLYIPLGGNRLGEFATYRNLAITMLLGGLWHGAHWNFVLWGALHGLALGAHRFYCSVATRVPRLQVIRQSWPFSVASWFALQVFVLFTWLTFRITDSSKLLEAISKFVFFDFNFRMKGIGLGAVSLFSTVAIVGVFLALHAFSRATGGLDKFVAKLPWPLAMLVCGVAGYFLLLFWPTAETPFIYFQF